MKTKNWSSDRSLIITSSISVSNGQNYLKDRFFFIIVDAPKLFKFLVFFVIIITFIFRFLHAQSWNETYWNMSGQLIRNATESIRFTI